MCNEACGAAGVCESGPTTAYEEIEKRLNYNYLANHLPTRPGKRFIGFVDVKCIDIGYVPKVVELYNLGNQSIGTCVKADFSDPNYPEDPLNCVYCSIYDQIGENPFLIPEGKSFVSINLGVDFCFCGGSVCEYTANRIRANYCYGTPVFGLTIAPGWDNPLDTDIDDFSF